MDLTSGAFIAVLVIVGGIAGYSADVIGRNIGKKRLHFRRMRPKHTAAVASAIAGMIIPLATVGVLYGLSSDVRIWLQEGRRAIWDKDKAIRAKGEAEQQLGGVMKTLNEKSSEYNKLNSQFNELEMKRSKTATQLEAAKADYAAANEKYHSINSKLTSTQREYRGLQGTYATLRTTFGGMSAQYKVIERRMQDADQHGIVLDLELQRQRKELDAKKSEISEIETRRKSLEEDLNTLKLQSDSASKIFSEQIREQSRLLETEKLKLDQAKGERETLESQNAALRQGFESSRQLPMIFARGDELARIAAPEGLKPDSARSALLSLLRASRSVAVSREAAPPPGGREVTGLFDQRVDGEIITAAQQENMTIDAIVRSKTPVVVISHSLWNAFKGEFVPLVINVQPNPVIYEEGNRILEARIDGGASEGEIIDQISRFLQGPLTEKALKDGMIPAIGNESPLGVISRDAILTVVREVVSTHRMVRVGAYATGTIRAGDQLRMEFRVR